MKTLRYHKTLFFYDGVQVFSALDDIGGNYLAVLTDSAEETDEYLAVGISPESLRQFQSGAIDLREAITKRVAEEWFLIAVANIREELKLVPQEGEIPEEILPSDGFIISPILDSKSELVVSVAARRQNAILEVWINPPEAAKESKIHAATLASFLQHIQLLVKHSYTKALATMSPQTRKGLDVEDAHLLDALAFAGGSFRVVFEAAKGPDLFGFVELQRALEKLDEITSNADSPEKALEVLRHNQGHIASRYIRFLEFLIKTDTAFAYRWSAPSIGQVRGSTITQKQAIPLLELLRTENQLSVETVKLHGTLKEANAYNNTWVLESLEDRQRFHGETAPMITVSNLTIDKAYRFMCEEQLFEQPATGKEIKKLILLSYNIG